MKMEHTDLALDTEGIPILTDLVTEGARDDAADQSPQQTSAEIVSELLQSERVKNQLDEIAASLARDARLQIEQTLAAAIDEAINKTLDNNSVSAYENIRRQLDLALPELLQQTLRDNDLTS